VAFQYDVVPTVGLSVVVIKHALLQLVGTRVLGRITGVAVVEYGRERN